MFFGSFDTIRSFYICCRSLLRSSVSFLVLLLSKCHFVQDDKEYISTDKPRMRINDVVAIWEDAARASFELGIIDKKRELDV